MLTPRRLPLPSSLGIRHRSWLPIRQSATETIQSTPKPLSRYSPSLADRPSTQAYNPTETLLEPHRAQKHFVPTEWHRDEQYTTQRRLAIPPKIRGEFVARSTKLKPREPINSYSDFTLLELKAELGHRRLYEKGTKSEIIERLEEDDVIKRSEPYMHLGPRIRRTRLFPRTERKIARFNPGKNFILPGNFVPKSHQPVLPRTFTTAVAPRFSNTAATDPATLPKLWEADAPATPIRVPFLPDNEFARYHRREYVPVVAPPHRPKVTTVDEDTSSLSAPSVSWSGDGEVEFLDKGDGGGAAPVLAPREDDAGDPMTEGKEVTIKSTAVAVTVWWLAGEPVMRLFGVL